MVLIITSPVVICIRPYCHLLHVLCYLSNVIVNNVLTIRFSLIITRPIVTCIRPYCPLLHVLCYPSNVIANKALRIRLSHHFEVGCHLLDTPAVSVIIILTAVVRLVCCP